MNKGLIGLGVVALIGVGGYYGLNAHASAKAQEQVDKIIEEMNAQPQQNVTYGNVTANAFTNNVTITDVQFNVERDVSATAETVTLTADSLDKNNLPNSMDMYVDNIRFEGNDRDMAEIQEFAPYLNEIVVDFGANYSFDEKKDAFVMAISGGVENAMSFEGAFELGNVADIWNELKLATKEQREPTLQGLSPETVTLNLLTLKGEDKGYRDGIIKFAGEEENLSPAEVEKNVMETLERDRTLPEEFKPEFAKLIKGEADKLTFTVKPEEPIRFGVLPMLAMAPKDKVVEKFNVTLKAK